jgi:hypothetical protein
MSTLRVECDECDWHAWPDFSWVCGMDGPQLRDAAQFMADRLVDHKQSKHGADSGREQG